MNTQLSSKISTEEILRCQKFSLLIQNFLDDIKIIQCSKYENQFILKLSVVEICGGINNILSTLLKNRNIHQNLLT